MRRFKRLAMLCAVLAPIVVAGLTAAPAGAVTAPSQDPFYTPPPGFQHTWPGTILRSRQVTMSGPQAADSSAAYQLMFRSTNATGQPIAAVTTILIPSEPASGTRVLATYATAYDSLTLNCAPSYTMQDGNGSDEEADIAAELAQGWDVNVPDYEGLESEWTVGPLLGLVTLDSIRAVEQFRPDGLTAGSRTKATVNGYSGGSEAATWAASLKPIYAPRMNLVGTEIGAMEAFSRAYPDFNLKRFLNPAGLALAAADGQDASGCAGSTTNEPYKNASDFTLFPSSAALAADPLFKRVAARMSLRYAPYPRTPELLYNGVGDELAHIQPVDALIQQYCKAGVTVDYDRDPAGVEHVQAFGTYWPVALQYLQSRFAGQAPPDNCSTDTTTSASALG
jgi:hypothetical protein